MATRPHKHQGGTRVHPPAASAGVPRTPPGGGPAGTAAAARPDGQAAGVVAAVSRELAARGPEGTGQVSRPAVIEVRGLRKSYDGFEAVAGIDLEVRAGEIFGILGPNGAGKTTTVECISGLRKPDGGTISVLCLDPQRDRAALRERVGVQLQEGTLRSQLTVAETVNLFASFYPQPADTDELIEMLGLGPKRNTYYRRLSGGQKQRLSIALALVGNPQIAILDELTTGLDPQARRETWQLIETIRDRGITILLVTHFMDEAERLCNRVAVIDSGQVVALDTPVGLAERAGGGNHMRFRPSKPFDDRVLTVLAEVDRVEHEGPRLVVSGTGELFNVVVHALNAAGVEALEVQLESATLEDAFLRLIQPTPKGRKEVTTP